MQNLDDLKVFEISNVFFLICKKYNQLVVQWAAL